MWFCLNLHYSNHRQKNMLYCTSASKNLLIETMNLAWIFFKNQTNNFQHAIKYTVWTTDKTKQIKFIHIFNKCIKCVYRKLTCLFWICYSAIFWHYPSIVWSLFLLKWLIYNLSFDSVHWIRNCWSCRWKCYCDHRTTRKESAYRMQGTPGYCCLVQKCVSSLNIWI